MSSDGSDVSPASQAGQTPQHVLGDGTRALVATAAAFIVLFGLKYTRDVTVPIVLAAFLAIVSYPIIEFLRKMIRFPHWLAVTCAVLVDMGAIYGLASLVKFLVADMKSTLQGDFMSNLEHRVNELLTWSDQFFFGEQLRNLVDSPMSLFNGQQLIALSQSLTGHVVSFMSVTVLVLILMTFMLGEAPLFQRNLNNLPNSRQGRLKVLPALRGVQKYLIIKTLASVSTGLLAWALCHIMKVPFAFMWGCVACALNFIPTIGSIVAAVPPILLALVMLDWGSMLIVAGGYLGISFAIGNGIEPLFLGKQFGIATSMVLISVIVWGWVWGPIGMLLAVPFTLFLKLAMENSADLRWVAAIIDDAPQTESPPATNLSDASRA